MMNSQDSEKPVVGAEEEVKNEKDSATVAPAQAETTQEDAATTQNTDQPTPETTTAETAPTEEPKPEETPEPTEEKAEESKPTFKTRQSKAEIVARLKQIVQDNEEIDKAEIDYLKQAFYKYHKAEVEALCQKFIEDGGKIEDFLPAPDPDESTFKAEMSVIKDRRNAEREEQEKQKEENYEKKLAIIEQIKAMLGDPEKANQSYKEFKELRTQWNDIKQVPAEKANDLWKNYQLYCEEFYDLLKLNNEFREYDFKKNLELKTKVIEAAEKLEAADDIVSAFHQLQKLHEEFRAIGPVAKDLREQVWTRFKAASTIINKRHQAHFENLKKQEDQNLADKTALCEQVEAIKVDGISHHSQWEELTKKVLDIQAKWKTIGFTPQKMNAAIFERFRKACDIFFKAKGEFYKNKREEQAVNLKKRLELCEQAEALQDSTDWKGTASKLIELQKQWKTIGSVSKKYSQSTWNRFSTACDHFFEQRKKNGGNFNNAEVENLKKKKDVITRLKAINTEDASDENVKNFRALMKEWNNIGHVPYKEKDKVYEAYHAAIDKLFEAFHLSVAQHKLNDFKSTLTNRKEDSLSRERSRLTRMRDGMRNDLKTYENNLCFLNSSSKRGNSLIAEVNRKVEKLKNDIKLVEEKIAAIDHHE